MHAKKVSNYIVGQLLGRGAFSEVHIAVHTTTQEQVALMILDKSKMIGQKDFEYIVREIRILKLLKHPNIIDLIDVLDSSHNIYIVTELAHNGSLLGYLQKVNRFCEKEACGYFTQIVSAVQYCHDHRVVHRDLKLENVLLDKNNNVKIIDFGLSNVLVNEEKMRTHCGSPSYVAPEILLTAPYSGPEVDVWACGVLLFALLCGFFPFCEDTTDKLYEKIVQCSYEIPSEISPEAADLIKKILVANPKRRITLSEILQHPFVQKNSDVKAFNTQGDDPRIVDFRLAVKIQNELNCSGLQVLHDVVMRKHTQMSATYYLLHEKRQKPWMFQEQAESALRLGFILQEDKTIEPIIIEEVGDKEKMINSIRKEIVEELQSQKQ